MSTFVKRIKDQRGVTLIELLAVIVILGIIAAVAVPAVMSNFDSAKVNADKQTEAILIDATQRYMLENTLPAATGGVHTLSTATLAAAGYINDGAIVNSKNETPTIEIDETTKKVSIDWN